MRAGSCEAVLRAAVTGADARNGQIVVLSCAEGQKAWHVIQACHPQSVDCVDCFQDETLFRHNMSVLTAGNFRVHSLDPLTFLEHDFYTTSLKFVFLEHVAEDAYEKVVRLARQKLEPGGVLCATVRSGDAQDDPRSAVLQRNLSASGFVTLHDNIWVWKRHDLEPEKKRDLQPHVPFRLWYGAESTFVDVTLAALDCFGTDLELLLPTGDSRRASAFGDPCPGVLKSIILIDDTTGAPYLIDSSRPFVLSLSGNPMAEIKARLDLLHRQIRLEPPASMRDEYPEQVMSMLFVRPDSSGVLELGSNIGRNSLVIAALLNDSSRLVTLETDPATFAILNRNRDANGARFRSENCALSKRRIAFENWISIPLADDQEVPTGFRETAITDLDALERKYELTFDTLVVDIEGALYHVLRDFPDFFARFCCVLMENDYVHWEHKQFVDSKLKQYGFRRVYHRAGGWGECYNFFYEAWRKGA